MNTAWNVISEGQLRLIVENAPIGMAIVSLEGRFLCVNRALCELVGYSAEQLLALTFETITHPSDLEADKKLAEALLNAEISSYQLNKRYQHQDGSPVDVVLHVTLLRDGAGEPLHVMAQIQDVTEQKRLEHERERYFETSLDMFAILGMDGSYRRINPAWSEVLGYTQAELRALPFFHLLHPDEHAAATTAWSRLLQGKSLSCGLRLRAKDGTTHWLEWKCVPDLECQLVYATARDLTVHRDLLARLQCADRMASVGTLAAGVAHEVNNPLSYVISNLELAMEELQRAECESCSDHSSGDIVKLLGAAKEGADRVRGIVRSLRTFAQGDEERLELLSLNPVLELALTMTMSALRSRARIVRQFRPTPRVHANEARLAQVFINLLINAAHALPESEADQHEVCVSTHTDAAGRAVVEISDTGSGIDEAILPRIFDPFFSTKATGAGLGLSICHGVISALGGELCVVPAKRTTFRIALPSAEPAYAEPLPTLAQARKSPRGRVLVVDDEPSVRVTLSRVLSPEHHVEVAAGGRDALERLRSGKRFDIILCDLHMPGMTGLEVFETLAREAPELGARFVFMSGSMPESDGDPEQSSLPKPCLDKPFDLKQVRELVRASTARRC